jgi:hypothetical protein
LYPSFTVTKIWRRRLYRFGPVTPYGPFSHGNLSKNDINIYPKWSIPIVWTSLSQDCQSYTALHSLTRAAFIKRVNKLSPESKARSLSRD